MKVLQLAKFFPPVPGGMESVVFELTEELNRHGIRTDVLCAHTAARTLRETQAGGYRVTRAASWGKLLSTSVAPALAVELLRLHRQYDLMHVHLPDPLANLALYLARPGCPLVVHWHSDIVQQKVALRFYEPLQRWLLERADALVATSPPYASSSPWLAEFRDKVAVIPIGIRSPAGEGAERVARIRERFGGRRLVFALGRMTYYKGFELLFDVVPRLPEDVVVVVGGSGELLDRHRRRAAALGLSERLCFVGHIPDEDLPAFHEAAALFCLPSTVRAEAFGVVLLEAMARRRPIVACRIPGSGVPWVNRHGVTGFNVPVGDAAAMAGAIRLLLEDTALAQHMGEAAHARFVEHFGAGRMAERTLALYRQLLARPLARPELPASG